MFDISDPCSYIFATRPFWSEMNVPERVVRQEYKKFLGDENKVIANRTEAISYLTEIVGKIQEIFVQRIKSENVNETIKRLYKILDECFHFYMRQKEARNKLVEMRVNDSGIGDIFEENRNMSRNVIDSVNLWLENCLLYQNDVNKPYDTRAFEIDAPLFVDLYLYGLASRALSLINLSKKFGENVLYYGIEVDVSKNEPLNILEYHPVIYFNPLLTGNQFVFGVGVEDYKKAGETEFGKGFQATYGVDFILALRTMSTIQSEMLKNGKYAYIVLDRKQLIDFVNVYTDNQVDGQTFVNAFTLTRENVSNQLRKNDPIIWVMSSNKYRHEICPFICFANDRMTVSYTAMEQSKYLWMSLYSNGGMVYSNAKNALTEAIKKRNMELSNQLVDILRSKLRAHYDAGFDEIDVKYDRIFGKKNNDYGDYDLVFYAKERKELFLIEAKFFSDSLNNSGMISDYQKLFQRGGYYEHCRKRYDLVLAESEKMKSFIGANGDTIKAHFLFVSSKPLEIEFQDVDGVVSFPCLSIFDDYLEGKLLPEVGDEPVRPVHIL